MLRDTPVRTHMHILQIVRISTALADLVGGCAGHTPPYGTKFFHFCIHFCQKAPMSEVHAPPTGNPGSATAQLSCELVLYSHNKVVVEAKTYLAETQIISIKTSGGTVVFASNRSKSLIK